MADLRGKKCPKCGRRGLHYARHPHAWAVIDHSRIACRFCQARFKAR